MEEIVVERRSPGSAAALVIHGNDLCGEFYLQFAEGLAARGISVFLPTLAGFDEQPPYHDPSWDRYASDIAERFQRLDGSPTTLIGHSMGGLMALLASAKLGTRLDRLVLIEPAIYPYRFMAQISSKVYMKRVVLADRERFENSTGLMPRIHDLAEYPREKIELYLRVRARSHVPTMQALFSSLSSTFPLPFSGVPKSTLVVNGGQIGIGGRALAWMVRRRFSTAQHAVIHGAAHWIVGERDAALAERVASFAS